MLTREPLVTARGGLTWTARWFTLQLALLTPVVHLYLMVFGYQRTLAALQRWVDGQKCPPAKIEDVEQFAWGMRRINRKVRDGSLFPGRCLSRSLALWLLLQRRGIAARLRIGCRKLEGRFQAHAWVELMGRPLNAGARVNSHYAGFQHNFDQLEG